MVSGQGRAFLREGMTAQALRAAPLVHVNMHCRAVDGGVTGARVIRTVRCPAGYALHIREGALTLPMGWSLGIWPSSSGSIGAPPARLPVTSIALISNVSASIPR